jgi:voltage-gated potassium channel
VVAAFAMLLGYSIIAVPTGIVSVELAQAGHVRRERACAACGLEVHDGDAAFCKRCGGRL